jgi:molybdenum cofactor cytidylyltransferase
MPGVKLQIAGIMLAAGASSRMGTNKLLLRIAGETLVRRACGRALGAGLAPLIVVVGHEFEQVRSALSGLPCQFALNSELGSPMSSSLHRGIEALPANTDAAVVMLADMINVTEHMLRALAAAAATSVAPLVSSRYDATLAPPVLFRRELFAELLGSTGEGCGKAVVERHRTHAHFIDWPPAALMDVDTPEQFAQL